MEAAETVWAPLTSPVIWFFWKKKKKEVTFGKLWLVNWKIANVQNYILYIDERYEW